MNYVALYRVYRPQDFSDVSGQEVIVRTLKNAVINDKIGHAYVFSGPRGTGKTTCAKFWCIDDFLKTKKRLNEILAANTGKPYETIAADTERDNYMSAQEAAEYGLIDSVITNR